MRRLELYVANNNELVLGVFDPIQSEYEKYILKGNDVFRYLKRLQKQKIINIIEDSNDIDVTLAYKNYIVNLNEYEKLLNRKDLSMLMMHIKEYAERKKLIKIKGKKVKRKNKHTGKKIMAGGIAFIVLTLGTLNIVKNVGASSAAEFEIVETLDETEEDYKINKYVYEDVDLQEQLNINKDEKETQTSITIRYEDRSDTQKAVKTAKNYGFLIEKYAAIYGIDPSLALAIATQERGVHSSVMDAGGATGLMQIQNSVWIGQDVKAYNFKTKRIESFKVENYMLQDLEYNIKIGCMIIQNSFQYMKYNPLAAIQCYNMGYGNMMRILKQYSLDTGRSIDNILSDINDDGWLQYRNIITQGDQNYVEHVVSWMGDSVNIKNIKADGTLISASINNNSKKVY